MPNLEAMRSFNESVVNMGPQSCQFSQRNVCLEARTQFCLGAEHILTSDLKRVGGKKGIFQVKASSLRDASHKNVRESSRVRYIARDISGQRPVQYGSEKYWTGNGVIWLIDFSSSLSELTNVEFRIKQHQQLFISITEQFLIKYLDY